MKWGNTHTHTYTEIETDTHTHTSFVLLKFLQKKDMLQIFELLSYKYTLSKLLGFLRLPHSINSELFQQNIIKIKFSKPLSS